MSGSPASALKPKKSHHPPSNPHHRRTIPVHALRSQTIPAGRIFALHHLQLLPPTPLPLQPRPQRISSSPTNPRADPSPSSVPVSMPTSSCPSTSTSSSTSPPQIHARPVPEVLQAIRLAKHLKGLERAPLASPLLRPKHPRRRSPSVRSSTTSTRTPSNEASYQAPADYPWSSAHHSQSGLPGTIEIESEWTARARETPLIAIKPR